ncbi:hypothetical protein [Tardiphaga robiniae]|uniref:hypothetical protein n=1 Tax=Tardiphaga robiniae TaxID=943830 RepID=UPI0015866BF4|nr:hypothetical protein [Tardiphaga robiniae]NUU44542.1 hypothetical protein [Tardiphaga robiniae]
MNQLVTLPLAATPVAVQLLPSPARAAEGYEARLITLADELTRLRGLCRQRSIELGKCDDAWVRPERPRVLLKRYDDGDVGSYTRQADGRWEEWCVEDDIDKLRGRTEFHQWNFIGTSEQWDEFGLSNWRSNRSLPAGAPADLFVSLGDEQRRKRADELIAALDTHREAHAKSRQESGYDAADRALRAVWDEEAAVFEEMMELKPTTLAGFRAVASAIINFCWLGEIEDGNTKEEQMVGLMLSHLTGIEVKRAA